MGNQVAYHPFQAAAVFRQTEDVQHYRPADHHMAKRAYELQGRKRKSPFARISQNDQQSAQRHLQPCGEVLQPQRESLQESRQHGQEEKPRNAVLDERGISEIRRSDDGQAPVLLRI